LMSSRCIKGRTEENCEATFSPSFPKGFVRIDAFLELWLINYL